MGKRQPTRRLTPLETLVMGCVWHLKRATVRDVQTRLKDQKPLAYNTVLTVMRILREKGVLASDRQGRLDVYYPVMGRAQAARRSVRDLLDGFFSGSSAELMSQLIDGEDLSPEDLERIRTQIDARLKGREGGAP